MYNDTTKEVQNMAYRKYNAAQKPGESMERYYRRLAKAADQRLVRLEAYSHEEHYKNILEWSYSRAMKDIEHWSGSGATRFNTAPPKSPQELAAKIEDIKQFLESATSTKQGIEEIYKKRADSFNKTNGTSFTWQDLATFFERGGNELLDTQYGSETRFRAVGAIQKADPQKIKEAIEEGSAKHLKLSDDSEVDARARKFIEENGADLLYLFPELNKAGEK